MCTHEEVKSVLPGKCGLYYKFPVIYRRDFVSSIAIQDDSASYVNENKRNVLAKAISTA